MIIGIDAVEINRFTQWHTKSIQQLSRLLSAAEIVYCLQNIPFSAQRFAVRFAAREAFYKALIQIYPTLPPYLILCKAVEIIHHQQGFPSLEVNWTKLGIYPLQVSISLTHSSCCATAVVCLAGLKNKLLKNSLTKGTKGL